MGMSDLNPIHEFLEEAAAREAKWNQLLSYWCKLFPSVTYAPGDFYALVAEHLAAQQVPALEVNRVLLRQSGPFSPGRLYFELRRERLVFEICGAPFGTGFFVSSRLFDRRREATLLDLALLFLAIGMCGAPVAFRFGWVWGVIAVTGIIALLASVMRLAATETLAWLDRTLADLPFLGLIYERFFHPDTYYRHDTNNAYREAVHLAVLRAIDDMTTKKGLQPLADDERRPILRTLERT